MALSDYFGKKPVLLVMPFYKCPGICTQELNGMVDIFRDPKIKYKVGRDFEVVTVSINPKETPELAAMKKKEYLNQLGQPGAEKGWHFLVGDGASVQKLASQIGFKFRWDEQGKQWAHSAAAIVLTPQGEISRYLYGILFDPQTVRLGGHSPAAK